jgi:light-regulated signal transduction histidine kinase (bacteriophytochrome)
MDEFEEGTVDSLSKPLNLEETRNKVAFAEMMYHLRMDRTEALQAAGAIAREHEQFVSKLGHDLKSPMRAIHNLSNWIAEDLGNSGNPNIRENLTLLQNRMSRLHTMLDAIIEYDACGRPMGNVEPVEPDKLIHVVFESLAPPGGFHIEVSKMPVVLIEKDRLFKIFCHLISNSILHHHDPANGKIVVTCEVNEAHFIIRVADNGPGIKPQHTGKIFELFGMMHSIEDPGTRGAGLALTKRLVQGMGQHIWMEPGGHGKGSVFCFTLERTGPQNLK